MPSLLLKGHKAQEPEQGAVNLSGERVYLTLTDSVFLELSVGSHCAHRERLLLKVTVAVLGNSVGTALLWGWLYLAGA